jgi:conjugal transfer pilus assembly protein TraF
LCLLLATGKAEEGRFYRGKEEGWFWYKDKAVVEEKKPDSNFPQPLPFSHIEPSKAVFSTAWLRENLPKVRDMAIDNPTPENVAAYFALQRVAMDKAERFSRTARMLPMLYPELDENIRRPIASFAAQAVDRQAAQEKQRALSEIAKKAGIFFFFKSDCPYCQAQSPVLKMLEEKHGFKVVAISVDGAGMPGDLYQDFKIDQGQAEMLGVVQTPAMFLVRPEEEPSRRIRLLGQGALSLSELEDRILDVAVEAGWIDQKTYKKTLPVAPLYLDPDRLLENGKEISPTTLRAHNNYGSGIQDFFVEH